MSNQRSLRLGAGWLSLLLFGVALLPRLPGLGRFLTSDENTNLFLAGSDVIAAVLRGDLRGTYWHFYPGVTISWLDAVGLAGQYWLTAPSQPFIDYIYNDILSLIVAVRLPYALLSALAVPAIFLLARRLLPDWLALLGALFLAFDPFFLAHSRVIHGDAPVAIFMAISALAFFVAVSVSASQPPPAGERTAVLKNPYLWLSAVGGGLAALTKAPGQFMAVFVVGFSLLYALLDWRAARKTAPELRITNYQWRIVLHWLTVVALWGLISLATFILLWPSMWVDPVGTLGQMLAETFGKVEEGHLVYFMGRPTLDPGLWFYLVVLPFRLTPITLSGLLLSLLLFAPPLRRRTGLPLQPLAWLWLFVVTLLLFGNLSPKKQDRYLLPLFPFFNLLAAVGWGGVITLAVAVFQPPQKNEETGEHPPSCRRWLLPSLLLVALQAVPVITYYPYYLAYFNPLLGGPTRAAETTLLGWGEGMEQVAAYLNTKPNAEQLYVASTPSQTLLPYFAGAGENFYTNDIALRADYVVLYLAQMQRLAPSPEIVRYYAAQPPEKVITIAGVDYAKIYPNPRRILSDIPPEATPQNIGLEDKLRLAGYIIGPESLSLTLYWHVLAPLTENYTISVRAVDANGERLAQQDQRPVEGLLPTRDLRLGDTVADTHLLPLAPADTPRLAAFEIVVYNADTGQTLGPPLSISNEK